METSFFKRVGAYLIDVIMLSLIISIITLPISTKETKKYNDELNKIIEKYNISSSTETTKDEITEEEIPKTNQQETTEFNYTKFIKEIAPLEYDISKSSVISTIIQIVITIAYFIGLQYYMKGQTIGKKILKIKVVENNKEPSLKAIILRTIIVDSILTNIIGVLLLYIINRDSYYMAFLFVSMIELMFTFTSALFILYRKDKIGLHDMMANTKVIEVKE